jgi:hypothetical protein
VPKEHIKISMRQPLDATVRGHMRWSIIPSEGLERLSSEISE